jgi:transposase
MSKAPRRSFSKEYKLNAVRRVEAREQPLTQVARELGIAASLLQTWKRQYKSETESTGSSSSSKTALEEENRRLRREIASLREDREILKKAAAFFAKEPQ